MESGTPSLNILIVDDDIPLSIFFRDTLQMLGHKVFVAVNEHGALGLVNQETIHIVICDYLLPGVDGAAIVNIIKELRKEIFCVLISGHHHQLNINRHNVQKADLVMMKPVLKEHLNEILRQYFLTQTNPSTQQ